MTLWPADAAESRARLQAIVDRELPRLKALEEMLRVNYEVPARAEAQQMTLAIVTREDMSLLRAEQMHAQAYERATAALMKARKQTAASRRPAVRAEAEATVVAAPAAPAPASAVPTDDRAAARRSEHRSAVGARVWRCGVWVPAAARRRGGSAIKNL